MQSDPHLSRITHFVDATGHDCFTEDRCALFQQRVRRIWRDLHNVMSALVAVKTLALTSMTNFLSSTDIPLISSAPPSGEWGALEEPAHHS